MELFDYLNLFFSSKDDFDKLSTADKEKYAFMINRIMCMQYPMQAHLFNKINISPLGVVLSWRIVARKIGRTPKWVWEGLKVKKSKASTDKKELKIKKDKIIEYYEIGYNDLKIFNE